MKVTCYEQERQICVFYCDDKKINLNCEMTRDSVCHTFLRHFLFKATCNIFKLYILSMCGTLSINQATETHSLDICIIVLPGFLLEKDSIPSCGLHKRIQICKLNRRGV